MVSRWYARQSEHALYEQPRATARQMKYAQSLLKRVGAIPLGDYDGHIGAFRLLKDHLREVATDPPDRKELKRRFRSIAGRPSFDIREPTCSRPRRSNWAWIDPRSIARGRVLGKPFPRTEYDPSWMADLAQEILADHDSPSLYSHHFNDPRYGYVIVVSSIQGPLGPIRPIGTNGNHRSMAFDALRCPVVLAEVHDEHPPYRITYNDEDDDWGTTRDFLEWQEDRGALRLSSRPVVRQGSYLELRIADATTPWLVASPHNALAALDAYERFWDRKLKRVGALDVAELRATWRSAAQEDVRRPLHVEAITAEPLVRAPASIMTKVSSDVAPPSMKLHMG